MQALSGDAYLYPGMHSIRVEYFEMDGDQGIILEYSGPGTGNVRTVVPATVPGLLLGGSMEVHPA